MKKNILLTGFVGIATLTGCFSDNGREQVQNEFLQKYADLKSSRKVPGRVIEQNVNGERRVSGWFEYVDENGARIRETYRDLGKGNYISQKSVLDTRSPALQPDFDDLHNVNPNRSQIVEMGENQTQVSIGAWDGKTVLPKQNEGKVRE